MTSKSLPHIGLVMVIVAAGCGAPSADAPPPPPRPLGGDLPAYRAPEPAAAAEDRLAEAPSPTGGLTLRQSLALALMNNPDLAAFSWEQRAADARTLQAGLLPNPQAGVEVAEFGGSRGRSGFRGAETTFRISQPILLANKIGKRTRVAALQGSLAGWDYESKRLDVFTDTAMAFVAVLAVQERTTLAEESLALAEQVRVAVSERVRAGKVSPLEEQKASVAVAISRIELGRARRALQAARKRLAASWGSTDPAFARAEGSLAAIGPIPPVDRLRPLIAQNPDVARWGTELQFRRAAIELETARAVPDVTVGAGIQRFEETKDNAVILGLSVPLPVFDRNQGAILEARQKLRKALRQRRGTEVRVQAGLERAYQDLSASFMAAVALKDDVLPAARRAYQAARTGYRQGKFGFLDVLDAQRTLFEARRQYVDALADYHRARAETERLIGQNLDTAKSVEPTRKEPR